MMTSFHITNNMTLQQIKRSSKNQIQHPDMNEFFFLELEVWVRTKYWQKWTGSQHLNMLLIPKSTITF